MSHKLYLNVFPLFLPISSYMSLYLRLLRPVMHASSITYTFSYLWSASLLTIHRFVGARDVTTGAQAEYSFGWFGLFFCFSLAGYLGTSSGRNQGHHEPGGTGVVGGNKWMIRMISIRSFWMVWFGLPANWHFPGASLCWFFCLALLFVLYSTWKRAGFGWFDGVQTHWYLLYIRWFFIFFDLSFFFGFSFVLTGGGFTWVYNDC